MIFWIITFLIAVLCFLVVKSCHDDYGDIDKAIPLCILVVFIGIVLNSFVISLLNKTFREIETTTQHSVEIVSASLGSETSGQFFLGIGGFSNGERYYYYKKEGEKYKRGSLPVRECVIEESDSQPQIKWETYSYKKHWWIGPSSIEDTISEKTIVVPKGTIIERYKMQ